MSSECHEGNEQADVGVSDKDMFVRASVQEGSSQNGTWDLTLGRQSGQGGDNSWAAITES